MKKIIGKLFLRKSLIIKRFDIINGSEIAVSETAVSEQEKTLRGYSGQAI